MKNWTKLQLSESSTSFLIHITATSTAGDSVHTAGATELDEVYIWANNLHTANVLVTVEWGDADDPADILEMVFPFQEAPLLIIPGWPLTDSKVVKVFAATTAVINLFGYVHRAA